MSGQPHDVQPPARYVIRIRGHLGATMRRAFPTLYAETRDGDTFLRGAVADQAALHGVLAQIEALGLELLDLRRLPASQSPAKAPGRLAPAQPFGRRAERHPRQTEN